MCCSGPSYPFCNKSTSHCLQCGLKRLQDAQARVVLKVAMNFVPHAGLSALPSPGLSDFLISSDLGWGWGGGRSFLPCEPPRVCAAILAFNIDSHRLSFNVIFFMIIIPSDNYKRLAGLTPKRIRHSTNWRKWSRTPLRTLYKVYLDC